MTTKVILLRFLTYTITFGPMVTRIALIIICFLSIPIFSVSQQDAKLANHYYQSGEYEKSAMLYKRLSEQNGFNDYYFSQYIESLMAIEAYGKAENEIKKILKARPKLIQLYVTYGNLLERLAKTEEAEKQYRRAIRELSNHRGTISSLGNSFMRLTKYDLALETFQKGEELSGNSGMYSYSISEIYRRKNNVERMIHYYLQSPMSVTNRLSSVQNHFSRYLTNAEDYEILRKKLYEYVQAQPENIFFPEMIQWVFIKNKDYKRALRQARALDRRLEENGSRTYSLAQIAADAGDFDTAIEGFAYIIENKDPSSSFYIDAKRELLDAKRRKLISTNRYSKEDLLSLKEEYNIFLDETGRGSKTALIILELAELDALYLSNLEGAIVILNDLIKYPGVNKYVKANGKLDLGDYYLMNNEVWEATLLYSQVDKEFREDHLGEKARFKNAKLSYYIGDFEWAQEQFDILKSATSRLISNDAIDLSVFIMDNANLDTTYAPFKTLRSIRIIAISKQYGKGLSEVGFNWHAFSESCVAGRRLFCEGNGLDKT